MARVPKMASLDKFYTQRPNAGGTPTVRVDNRNPNPAPEMMSLEQAKSGLDKFYANSPNAGRQVPSPGGFYVLPTLVE